MDYISKKVAAYGQCVLVFIRTTTNIPELSRIRVRLERGVFMKIPWIGVDIF